MRALFEKREEVLGEKTFWKWEASGKDPSKPAFPIISRVITKSEAGFEAE